MISMLKLVRLKHELRQQNVSLVTGISQHRVCVAGKRDAANAGGG